MCVASRDSFRLQSLADWRGREFEAQRGRLREALGRQQAIEVEIAAVQQQLAECQRQRRAIQSARPLILAELELAEAGAETCRRELNELQDRLASAAQDVRREQGELLVRLEARHDEQQQRQDQAAAQRTFDEHAGRSASRRLASKTQSS